MFQVALKRHELKQFICILLTMSSTVVGNRNECSKRKRPFRKGKLAHPIPTDCAWVSEDATNALDMSFT